MFIAFFIINSMDQSNSQESARQNLDDLDEDMYVVEKILKKRTIVKHGKQTVMYFVRWEGYPAIEDHTWEPEENLISVPTLIKEFQQKLQEKKRKEREEAKRIQEAKKSENKCQAKQNDTQFRKIQNQNNEVEDKPHKLLKKGHSSVQPQDSYDFYRRKDSNGQKDPYIETSRDQREKAQRVYRVDPHVSSRKEDGKDYFNREKNRGEVDNRTASKDRKEYGRVVGHNYHQGQIFYEVQILSKDKKVRLVEQITSQVAASECQKSTLQYLQKVILRMQELNSQQ